MHDQGKTVDSETDASGEDRSHQQLSLAADVEHAGFKSESDRQAAEDQWRRLLEGALQRIAVADATDGQCPIGLKRIVPLDNDQHSS